MKEYRGSTISRVADDSWRNEAEMIRLSKLTDYGLVLMSEIARRPCTLHTARDLGRQCRLPLPTVSKLLKILLQSGLLASHRGIHGGYTLAQEPHAISIAEVISALEGPLAWTECSTEVAGLCDLESSCRIKDNQRVINQAVRGALENVMLSDFIQPMRLTSIRDKQGNMVRTATVVSGRMQ
jgi:FeS assembly SUF system regulator